MYQHNQNTLFVLIIFVAMSPIFCSNEESLRKLEIPQQRIIGGNIARLGQFPYQAGVLTIIRTPFQTMVSRPFCSGSIIHETWVITAAHCVQSPIGIPVYVLIGAANIRHSGEIIPLARIIPHHNYRAMLRNLEFDIALLNLAYTLRWNAYVKPLAMETQYLNEEVASVVSGWGITEHNIASDSLRYTTLYTITNYDCRARLGGYAVLVHNSVICALQQFGKGTCAGDDGSALVYQNRLLGIHSWHLGPCGSNTISGFTRVSEHMNWIISIVG